MLSVSNALRTGALTLVASALLSACIVVPAGRPHGAVVVSGGGGGAYVSGGAVVSGGYEVVGVAPPPPQVEIQVAPPGPG